MGEQKRNEGEAPCRAWSPGDHLCSKPKGHRMPHWCDTGTYTESWWDPPKPRPAARSFRGPSFSDLPTRGD